MLELVKAGGWLMWPIIACSVIAMAIVVERLWIYRRRRVLPANLVAQIWQLHQKNQLTAGAYPDRAQEFPARAHPGRRAGEPYAPARSS